MIGDDVTDFPSAHAWFGHGWLAAVLIALAVLLIGLIGAGLHSWWVADRRRRAIDTIIDSITNYIDAALVASGGDVFQRTRDLLGEIDSRLGFVMKLGSELKAERGKLQDALDNKPPKPEKKTKADDCGPPVLVTKLVCPPADCKPAEVEHANYEGLIERMRKALKQFRAWWKDPQRKHDLKHAQCELVDPAAVRFPVIPKLH